MIRLAGCACANANALARANALANALALARDLASDLDNAEVLVGTLARTNALARALTDAGALDLDRASDLDRAFHHTHALARALARGTARDLACDRAHDLARDLAELDPTAHWTRAVVAGGAGSTPGRMSRGLVVLAVRLLPIAARLRYRDELCGELIELPCRARWGHALRVLACGWQLRRAVVEAICTPDGAASRRAKR